MRSEGLWSVLHDAWLPVWHDGRQCPSGRGARISDLTFDVYAPEGLLLGSLEDETSLASQIAQAIVFVLKQSFTSVLAKELCALLIVVKGKL